MEQIEWEELKKWEHEAKTFLLLDVREAFERELFHIGGMHIPLGELHLYLDEIPKDKPVVVYCAKGIRSVIAIQKLQSKGFEHLYNLQGGINNQIKSQK